MARRPVAEIRADLDRTNKAIQKAVPGAKVPFYRQPGGRWTPEVLGVAKDLGMRPLHWASTRRTGTSRPRPRSASGSTPPPAPARIVLLHDGGGDRAATLAACPKMIADLKRRFGITRLR